MSNILDWKELDTGWVACQIGDFGELRLIQLHQNTYPTWKFQARVNDIPLRNYHFRFEERTFDETMTFPEAQAMCVEWFKTLDGGQLYAWATREVSLLTKEQLFDELFIVLEKYIGKPNNRKTRSAIAREASRFLKCVEFSIPNETNKP